MMNEGIKKIQQTGGLKAPNKDGNAKNLIIEAKLRLFAA